MAKNQKIRASLWDRFHSKVQKTDGCWIWTGAKKEHGYGVIGLGQRGTGTEKAHRTAYRLYKGDIAPGLCVLHSCDNPSCVNPEHLTVGTLSDNSRDMVAKGRNRVPDNRGERATWAKLDTAKVAHILEKDRTGIAYAKLYGVSKSTIYAVWSGANWGSVSAR